MSKARHAFGFSAKFPVCFLSAAESQPSAKIVCLFTLRLLLAAFPVIVASSLLPVELPWSLYFAGILSSWPFLRLRAPHHHSIKPSSSLSVDLVVENVLVLSWLSSLLCRSAEVAEMVKAGRLRSFLERHRFTRFSQAMREARKPYRSRKVNALYTFVLRHILRVYEQTALETLPVGITIHLNNQHCHRLSPARSVCVSLNAALICGVCRAIRTAC